MVGSARDAASLVAAWPAWDMVFPIEPWCGNDFGKLQRFQRAGFGFVNLCVAGDNHNVSEAIQRIASARSEVQSLEDELLLIEGVDDVARAAEQGKLAVALHLEGTRCFERNLQLVETFYCLGIRHALLAFNQTNSVGGGCAEHHDGGLSNFGALLVAEMERVGMLVDLSHTGERTTLDALQMATRPMVFSHSMAAAVTPHFRNLSDEQIRSCAGTGGVIGISGSGEYMGDIACSSEAQFRHIDHIASLVGPQHVGLGLDLVFDHEALNRWILTRPDEWPQAQAPDWPGFRYAAPEQLEALVDQMMQHGYADEDIAGVLSENWKRVCRECWR